MARLNLDYIEKRVLEIEQELTDIQLEGYMSGDEWKFGPPAAAAYARIDQLRIELETITGGENVILFTPDGVAESMYVVEPRDKALYKFSTWADYLENYPNDNDLLPCFIRGNMSRKRFYINKYKCSAIYTDSINHTNYLYGMYGMSPAHSNGGFTVSYEGVVSKVEALNASSLPPHFPASLKKYVHKKHMITWDEYAYITLLAARMSFNPSGDTNYGSDTSGRKGRPGEYLYSSSKSRPLTLNGTGPREWRHNGKFTGIADLVGGCRPILSGVKVKNGIIQIIDFTQQEGGALSAANLKDSSLLWKAIDVADGSLVDLSAVDGSTVKAYSIDMAQEMTGSSGTYIVSDEITIRDNGYYTSVLNSTVQWKEELRKDYRIQMAGYAPYSAGLDLLGYCYVRNADNASFVCVPGGYWYGGTTAGLRYLGGDNAFGGANYSIGSLLASD